MLKNTLLVILTLTLVSACETDFELEAPPRDIPVVYGFLSKQDTAHYIRVERAFQTDGADARDVAQDPDAIYYDNISVELERILTGQRFTLTAVNGNDEGYPREDGPFVEQPNLLYKIDANEIDLRGGEPIRLLINRSDNLPTITAETEILDDIEPRETSPSSPINMQYDRNVSISWIVGEKAQLFDLRMRINYRERAAGGSFESRSLEWVLDDDLRRMDETQTRITFRLLGEDFYRFLAASLPQQSDIVREFESIDLLFAAGGQEMIDFLQVSRANAGITSSQLVPVYSNLSEGRGIFTSRSRAERLGLQLNTEALDSLREGSITRSLNFQ